MLGFLRKKQIPKIKLPKIVKPKMKRSGIRGVSKEALVFERVNKGTVLQIYKTIRRNLLNLEMEKTVICPVTGAIIKNEFNGIHKGNQNQGVFSVEIHGKKFFVKFASALSTKLNANGAISATKIIKRKWKQGKIKVRVMTPHIIYTHTGKQKGIIITDYFDREETINLFEETKNRERKNKKVPGEAMGTFYNVRQLLYANGIDDIEIYNAFYHFKTKTIILYDLMSY